MCINLNMKRKSYIVIMSVIMFIIFLLEETLGRNKYEKTFIFNFLLSMWLFYTGYLLIVKKSYNLLAGMTEEKAIEIKNNSVEEKKVIKTAKIIGYIVIITALVLLVSAWTSIR